MNTNISNPILSDFNSFIYITPDIFNIIKIPNTINTPQPKISYHSIFLILHLVCNFSFLRQAQNGVGEIAMSFLNRFTCFVLIHSRLLHDGLDIFLRNARCRRALHFPDVPRNLERLLPHHVHFGDGRIPYDNILLRGADDDLLCLNLFLLDAQLLHHLLHLSWIHAREHREPLQKSASHLVKEDDEKDNDDAEDYDGSW